MGSRRRHSVVGIVVLTGGLFLGSTGGAIAAAEPESSASTAGDTGSHDSPRADGTKDTGDTGDTGHVGHAGDIGDTGGAGTADSTDQDGARPADEMPDTGRWPPRSDDERIGTPDSETRADPGVDTGSAVSPAADSHSTATSSEEPATAVTAPPAGTSPAVEPDPAPVPELVAAPVSSPSPPALAAAPAATAPDSPAPIAAAPTTTSVPAPPQAVAPPTAVYPVLLPPEYLRLLDNALNPLVATVGQLLTIPGDLYRLLLSMVADSPPAAGLPGAGGGVPPGFASLMKSPLALLLLAALDNTTVAAPGQGTLDGAGPTDTLSLLRLPQSAVGAADNPPRPDRAIAPAQSWLEHAVERVDELVVPVSLAMLAATALPGIGGILLLTAVGVRLGYRQAKAGIAVKVSAVARFLETEPPGPVWSGTVTAFRRWPLQAVRFDGAQEAGLLSRAA